MTVEQAAALHQVAVSRCEIHARQRDNARACVRWGWANPFGNRALFRDIVREQEAARVEWLAIANACADRIADDPTLNAYLRGHRA